MRNVDRRQTVDLKRSHQKQGDATHDGARTARRECSATGSRRPSLSLVQGRNGRCECCQAEEDQDRSGDSGRKCFPPFEERPAKRKWHGVERAGRERVAAGGSQFVVSSTTRSEEIELKTRRSARTQGNPARTMSRRVPTAAPQSTLRSPLIAKKPIIIGSAPSCELDEPIADAIAAVARSRHVARPEQRTISRPPSPPGAGRRWANTPS